MAQDRRRCEVTELPVHLVELSASLPRSLPGSFLFSPQGDLSTSVFLRWRALPPGRVFGDIFCPAIV